MPNNILGLKNVVGHSLFDSQFLVLKNRKIDIELMSNDN